MDFLPKKISTYAEKHTNEESVVLRQLNRQTHLKVMLPQMLSGKLQGQLLRMVSYMIRPMKILEIGTFTGYSAICLAEGMASGGVLYTIDKDPELIDMAQSYFKKAGMSKRIKALTGTALDIIPKLKGKFDIVFIDADKENYSNYFDQVIDKVKKGGFIIADNVLWGGRVLGNTRDKETVGIKAFNKKVLADDRVENLLLPIRDGLMILRKK
ncbi:MAG: O-methyltransferase [Bacteroidetes bacterium]|nr:O-methyltransferase [Bacteroidota bacterium]